MDATLPPPPEGAGVLQQVRLALPAQTERGTLDTARVHLRRGEEGHPISARLTLPAQIQPNTGVPRSMQLRAACGVLLASPAAPPSPTHPHPPYPNCPPQMWYDLYGVLAVVLG